MTQEARIRHIQQLNQCGIPVSVLLFMAEAVTLLKYYIRKVNVRDERDDLFGALTIVQCGFELQESVSSNV